VKNLGNFKLFVTKRAFFFKNQGFQAFLEAISVSCGNISQLFAKKGAFFS